MFNAKSSPILDVYAMLWHIVRAFPPVTDGAGKPIKYKRPGAFAALVDAQTDINKTALGKSNKYADPNEHLFYSRKWSGQGSRRQQTSTLAFDYPLVAVETQDATTYIKTGKTGLRVSLIVFDQQPGKDDHRTTEQLEADMTAIFDQTVREWLGRWGCYQLPDGTIQWSPVKIDDARPVKMMRDCLRADGVKGSYFHDAGVDMTAAVQGFIDLEMPRIDCYLPSGQGGPVAFDYDYGVESPRRPDGLPGNPNEQETLTA